MTMLDDRGSAENPEEPGELRAPEKQGVDVSFGSITGKLKTGLTEAGDIGRFTADTVRDFPDMFRRYVPEVFRQAGILIFSSALIIWFGGRWTLQGTLTLGSLVAFLLYSGRFFRPISDMSEKFNVLQAAMASSGALEPCTRKSKAG